MVLGLLGVAVLNYLLPAKWNHSVGNGVSGQPYGLLLAVIWLLGKVRDLKFAIQDAVYG